VDSQMLLQFTLHLTQQLHLLIAKGRHKDLRSIS